MMKTYHTRSGGKETARPKTPPVALEMRRLALQELAAFEVADEFPLFGGVYELAMSRPLW